ncbi:hypothetical protein EPA93_41800 [Ktedonosporobacter rubrisoli]|uniref:Anti-sigma factor n=1 Tax=Ktedonosporobacter rubrisoli TaxID=2509675 RepID=A0A4P6K222_KTERU|nr:hypothetical protein [Ktedonosporobacter rubrisoli]QBD82169.1 hypothetical protein EPA93_41800 [Ktedonosporobacter rubrisoli]
MMTDDELRELISELVDETLEESKRAKVEQALASNPDLQQELEIARQVRAFLVLMYGQNAQLQVPAGLEARLIARIRQQNKVGELVDLSSRLFGLWLVEFINLVGELFNPMASRQGQLRG